MKVFTTPTPFQPVTVTLESQDEYEALKHLAMNREYIGMVRHFRPASRRGYGDVTSSLSGRQINLLKELAEKL